MRTRILGLGTSIPEQILTNADLERIVDTSDEWIRSRTGIEERRRIEDGRDCSDLVAEACVNALADAAVKPEEIDALITATATADTLFPSTAAWAQPKIGLRRIPVFDISSACSGFLYANIVAEGLVATGSARRVLICGSEVLSRLTNWRDRGTCVLFGDGAGAAVIGRSENDDRGLLGSTWGADGSLAELLWLPAGGTRFPATHETVEHRKHTIHMCGNEVFKHAVKAMERAVGEVLDRTGVRGEDVDLFVPHQANVRIIKKTAERAGIPMEKVYLTIHKYGNTSAASIPMALKDAEESGRLREGNLVLCAAFGSGFTWAAALYRW